MAQTDQVPAFPGAEGHGRYTTGGRGGKVIHVTNLNDSGTGSLRSAVSGTSKKIVVFDVAGVIALKSDLKIGANTTILGQTAPAPGITLRYRTVQPGANNVIRFIRIRRGQEKDMNDGADATWNRQLTNMMLDHCSFSWSIDEVASFYDNKDFTLQWCTIGEPLNNAGHGKGAHGYGGIWGGKGASFHHNLLIHLENRAPRLNGARFFWKGPTGKEYPTVESCIDAEIVDFRNCVIYNTGTGNGAYGGMGGNHNIVNNYYKAGPATKNKTRVFQCSVTNSSDGTGTKDVNYPGGKWGKFYISGNYVTAASSPANYDWNGVTIDACKDAGITTPTKNQLKIPEVDKGVVTTHTAENAYLKVLDYAGASFCRDNVDERYARETKNNKPEYTGSVSKLPGIVDVVADVNGYTEANFGTGSRPDGFDSDNDGIPDAWETANGLNPNDASDANGYTVDSKGIYSNLEVYVNSLVQDIMLAGNANAETAVDEYYPAYKKEDGTLVPAIGDGSSAINDVTVSHEVGVDYFNTQGVRVSSDAKGVILKVCKMSDGTKRVVKTIR